MNREFVARRFAHLSPGVILLVALLALAGCRGSSESATPEATILPTATLVATMAPLTATPVPVEPTATAEPVAIEATMEATATEAAAPTEEVTTTEAITATEEVTAGEEITTTEGITATPEVITSEPVTTTEEVTAVEEVTVTEQITGQITGARPLIQMPQEGATSGIAPSSGITGSSQITGSAEIISTAEVTAAAAISDARLYFLQPTTNAIVPMTFTVVMSYTGLTVLEDEPLSETGTHATDTHESVTNAGHIHLIIDSDFIPAGEMIPADALHQHFSDGSTHTELSLTPGSHILRLQYADGNHMALDGDQFRHEIVVNVVDGAPEQAVRIVSPTSGATVPPTFTVVMAASGLNVEPAGLVNENAGHFHLLIDEPFVAAGKIVPTNDTHLHFGKAQLTTTVTLEPGNYLLRLQLADGSHRALSGNQYRAEVAVIVAEDAPDEQVMFVKPADGATVTSPFLVGWAASGLIIEAAGASIRPEAGHLHLLINEEFVAAGEAIPTDENHLHFGRGQTNTQLSLEPGEYTLRLQMANGAHIAHDGAHYRDEITVTVK